MTFRCSKCRSTLQPDRSKGWIGSIVLTGRVRRYEPRGVLGSRSGYVKVEYACNDCDHVGWSAHCDILELAVSLGWLSRFAAGLR